MPRIKQFDEKEALEKAMELFWKKGYNGVGMSELVKYLGTNRTNLYAAFNNKKELYERALAHYRKMGVSLFAELRAMDDPLDAIRLLFDKAIEADHNDPERKGCFVVNATTELASVDQSVHQITCQNQAFVKGFLVELLTKAQENGQLDSSKNIDGIAQYLFTLFSGLKVVTKYDLTAEEMEQIVEQGLKVLS